MLAALRCGRPSVAAAADVLQAQRATAPGGSRDGRSDARGREERCRFSRQPGSHTTHSLLATRDTRRRCCADGAGCVWRRHEANTGVEDERPGGVGGAGQVEARRGGACTARRRRRVTLLGQSTDGRVRGMRSTRGERERLARVAIATRLELARCASARQAARDDDSRTPGVGTRSRSRLPAPACPARGSCVAQPRLAADGRVVSAEQDTLSGRLSVPIPETKCRVAQGADARWKMRRDEGGTEGQRTGSS